MQEECKPVIVVLFISILAGCLIAQYKHNQKLSSEKIELYKTQLSEQDAIFIQKICDTDLNCWDKERAIMSGIEIRHERVGKIMQETYYMNNIKIK